MERQEFIKKINNLKLVAHRLGYAMTNYPENSINVLKTIFKNNQLLDICDGFEFDICFTKDHVPVVIHDKFLDDISDTTGFLKSYTIDQLKKVNFGFRKSSQKTKKHVFKIVTLEEMLTFFDSQIMFTKNKLIKIETKENLFLRQKDLKVLAETINKFPNLKDNIIHLSFWPMNLSSLKKVQRKKYYYQSKTDLLCDYQIIVFASKFMKSLDNISLRIKMHEFPKVSTNNSQRVNKGIRIDSYVMKFSSVIKEKNLKHAIDKYGSVGIYTLENYIDIDEFCKHISKDFFDKNCKKMVFTANNPLFIKTLK